MLNVLEAIQLSTDYLEKKGIESPRLNAEMLLASVLNCKRLELYLKFDKPLSSEETDKYRELLARRGKFEPLQYLTGLVEFYGLTLKVNSNVLIPRPETEILVETILDNYDKHLELKILDIGTGSGNISIALAKYLEGSVVDSIDISETALATASENAKINGVESKVNFIVHDVFQENGIFAAKKYNIIVSNPPYVNSDEYKNLQPEIKVYEPANAVTDYADGYNFYKHIINISSDILEPSGKLFFEVGKDQHDKIMALMEEKGFRNIGSKKDYQQIERIVFGEKE